MYIKNIKDVADQRTDLQFSYTEMVIKETLRLYPVGAITSRELDTPDEVSAYLPTYILT